MFWILLALIFKFVESEDPWYLLKCIIQTLILSAILQHQFFLETPLGSQVARPPRVSSCLFLSGFQRQIQNKQGANLNKQHIAVNSSSLFWCQAGLSAPPCLPHSTCWAGLWDFPPETVGSSPFLPQAERRYFIQDRSSDSQISPVSVPLTSHVDCLALTVQLLTSPLPVYYLEVHCSYFQHVIIHLFKCKWQEATRIMGNTPHSLRHKLSVILMRIFISI